MSGCGTGRERAGLRERALSALAPCSCRPRPRPPDSPRNLYSNSPSDSPASDVPLHGHSSFGRLEPRLGKQFRPPLATRRPQFPQAPPASAPCMDLLLSALASPWMAPASAPARWMAPASAPAPILPRTTSSKFLVGLVAGPVSFLPEPASASFLPVLASASAPDFREESCIDLGPLPASASGIHARIGLVRIGLVLAVLVRPLFHPLFQLSSSQPPSPFLFHPPSAVNSLFQASGSKVSQALFHSFHASSLLPPLFLRTPREAPRSGSSIASGGPASTSTPRLQVFGLPMLRSSRRPRLHPRRPRLPPPQPHPHRPPVPASAPASDGLPLQPWLGFG